MNKPTRIHKLSVTERTRTFTINLYKSWSLAQLGYFNYIIDQFTFSTLQSKAYYFDPSTRTWSKVCIGVRACGSTTTSINAARPESTARSKAAEKSSVRVTVSP
jgi:hypothetical protein